MGATYSCYLHAVRRLHKTECRLGAYLKAKRLKILKELRS